MSDNARSNVAHLPFAASIDALAFIIATILVLGTEKHRQVLIAVK
jgi:hypothetical protein